MDRYRLIASIVVMFIYMLAMYPWQTILVSVVIAIAYFILRNINSTPVEDGQTTRRMAALNVAKIYLAPYNNIWSNLKLTNKYCSLRLVNRTTIIGRDVVNTKRSFKIVDSRTHPYDELWNLLCLRFSYNTTFEELIQLCERFNARVTISNIDSNGTRVVEQPQNQPSYYNHTAKEYPAPAPPKQNKELLDVNNASEVELTALPGVSIVMAKKLIKRREEIGGFKSVNDVCSFLHLKPHMQTQLEKLICIKKMKGSMKIQRYNERSVDL